MIKKIEGEKDERHAEKKHKTKNKNNKKLK